MNSTDFSEVIEFEFSILLKEANLIVHVIKKLFPLTTLLLNSELVVVSFFIVQLKYQ